MQLSNKVIFLVIGMLESTVNLCLAQNYLLSVLNIVTCFLMSTALVVAVTHLLTLARSVALRHGLTTVCAPSRHTPVSQMLTSAMTCKAQITFRSVFVLTFNSVPRLDCAYIPPQSRLNWSKASVDDMST